jgi:hypothetical protein
MRTRRLSRIIAYCVVLGGGVVVGAPLSAQSSELRPGDVARVSATTPQVERLIGHVVALTPDTLVLETDEPAARIALPRSSLIKTERRLPNASRAEHTFAGAGLGLVGGAAIGGIAGSLSAKRCGIYSDGFCGRGFGAFVGTVTGGVLGLLAGTAIGIAMPVERWTPVNNVRLSLNPGGAATRGGLIVSLRF